MTVNVKTNSSSKSLVETSILDTIYPIGSVYLTINNNNPSTFLGGTWEQFGQGRTLIGQGTGNDGSNTIEFKEDTYGGEYKHKLDTNELPSHNHSINISGTTGGNSRGHTHNYTRASSVQGHTLTINEMPSHSHNISHMKASTEAGGYGLTKTPGFTNRVIITGDLNNSRRYTVSNSVGGGGSHSHGLNTTTDTSTGESQNHTHTFSYSGNTGNIGNGNGSNIIQPYIVIYFWKRTK